LQETIAYVIAAAAAFPETVGGERGIVGFLEAVVGFYRRARGTADRLAAWGYNTKHFARLFITVFERLCATDRTLRYKDLSRYIPDSCEQVPEVIAELTLAELATTTDVPWTEIPMWACLTGSPANNTLITKLLSVGDVGPVVRWHRDRVGHQDQDADTWPLTVPDTLEEWIALYESGSQARRIDPPPPVPRAASE